MRQDNNEIDQSKNLNKKIAISTLQSAFGVNERQISEAMKTAYAQYSKYFQSLESKAQYQTSKENDRKERRLPVGEVSSTFAKSTEEDMLDTLTLLVTKVENVSKIPVKEALSAVRTDLDALFSVTNKEGNEVLKKLSSIKLFTMINFVNNVQGIVAKSNPKDIEQNRIEGKNDFYNLTAMKKNESKGSSSVQDSVIRQAESLSLEFINKATLDTNKRFDLKKHLNVVNAPMENFVKFVSDEKGFSSLSNDDKQTFMVHMTQALKTMNKQLQVINKNDALESFREESPEYAKLQQSTSQLQEKVKDYSALLQSSQRKDFVGDQKNEQAKNEYQKPQEAAATVEAAPRRPSWTNSSSQKAAQELNKGPASTKGEEATQNPNKGTEKESESRSFSFKK